MISKGNLLLRTMSVNDYKIMAKWLSDEKVLKYYEEPSSDLEMVIKKYEPRINGNHYVTPCIVEYKDNPIGYIQFYKVNKEELAEYGYKANQLPFGIDQFIGETHLWGKGIGTLMIGLILKYLENIESSASVILNVKKNNERAIVCYMKCGFEKIKNLNNEFLLMVYTPKNKLE
ncbi:GNAT family N-acetyltransferase [Fictibacillus nanhaiensis]|uniref:GNAT family N-acetyltransferase n=1 Tax=Fictibacillus nanhaiensis TaxID=742169 RepID=UPI002E213BCF|nr:GNAT family N-acetyltransferase [Fictibacillus nanhaiensis]